MWGGAGRLDVTAMEKAQSNRNKLRVWCLPHVTRVGRQVLTVTFDFLSPLPLHQQLKKYLATSRGIFNNLIIILYQFFFKVQVNFFFKKPF